MKQVMVQTLEHDFKVSQKVRWAMDQGGAWYMAL